MKLSFRVLSSALKGQRCETDKQTIRVGRSEENDLVLNQHSVSRFHAMISCGPQGVSLDDAGSRNRTKVDGKVLDGSVVIKSGSIVEFGDVAVEVNFGQAEPASQETAERLLAGTAVSVASPAESPTRRSAALWRPREGGIAPAAEVPEGWFTAPSGTVAPAPVQKVAERRFWPALTLILGLAAAGLLVLFFVNRGGYLDQPLSEFGIALQVGEERVVEVPRGFVLEPRLEGPEIVKAVRPLNLDLAVQFNALAEGLTSVRLYNDKRQFIRVHVKVQPRELEQLEPVLADQVRSEPERISLAEGCMKRGDSFQQEGALYEAMKQYERALLLLEPFEKAPNRWYNQAKLRYENASEELQKRYERLTREMGDLINDGDKDAALKRLEEVRRLIPDEQDVRRQNADLLFRLLARVVEIEKRRDRRGL